MILLADVKWIKITTDIFDDEKILLIESLPESDAIIVIWFKLLCLAGKMNNSGVFMLNDTIPMTDQMLATIFRRKESTVTLALKTFEQFGMVEIIDNVVTIPKWGKHQSLDQIESRREYMKNYMRKKRAEQRQLIEDNSKSNDNANDDVNSKVNSKVNVNGADKNREDKSRKDKNREDKKVKHKYGEYNNVLLTDEEYQKLQAMFPDLQNRIERLSEYVASSGKSYKSHYATIRAWARKDKKPVQSQKSQEFEAKLERTAGWAERMRQRYDIE